MAHSKTAFDEFLAKGNEKGTFGFISQKEYFDDIFTCNESFSADTARVFWNTTTNEVIKLLGNFVFMHFDAEHRGRYSGCIETIPDSAFISVGINPSKVEFRNLFPPDTTKIEEEELDEYPDLTDEQLSDDISPVAFNSLQPTNETKQMISEQHFLDKKESTNTQIRINQICKPRTTASSASTTSDVFSGSQSVANFTKPVNFSANFGVKSFNQYSKDHKANVLLQKQDKRELQVSLALQQQKCRLLEQENAELKKHNFAIMNQADINLSKIAELQKENEILKSTKSYLDSSLKETKEKYEKIKALYEKLMSMYNRAKEEFSKPSYEKVFAYFDSCSSDKLSITKLGWITQREMFINSHCFPGHRKYSDDTKKLFWIICSQCFTAYDTLKQVLPLPCYNTINATVKKEIIETECALLDLKYIPSFVDKFLSKFTNSVVGATLAIDALVVTPKSLCDVKRTFNAVSPKLLRAFNTQLYFRDNIKQNPVQDVFGEAISQENKEDTPTQKSDFEKSKSEPKDVMMNNVFIFYVEPINPNIPCFPVHLWLQHGGSANKTVRALTENIIELVNSSGACLIKQTSTDGDLGHQIEYKNALQKILTISKSLDIEEICAGIHERIPQLASADMLHFLKTLRIKILVHVLCLVPYRLTSIFDINTLGDLFGNGKEMTDLTHLGKMRDVYPILFFSLKNLVNLKRKAIWSGVLLFTPWSLWIASTLNTAFTTKARIFMLNVCFEIIIRLYNLALTKEEWLSTVGEIAGESKSYLTFVSQNVLERIIPTFVTLIAYLKEYVEIEELLQSNKEIEKEKEVVHDEGKQMEMKTKQDELNERIKEICSSLGLPYDLCIDFAFDRFGTHPLENFNGNIRDIAHNSDTINSTPHIIARAHVQKCLKNELELNNTKRTRINAGGIRLSESLNIINPPEVAPAEIVESLFIMADGATKETIMKRQLSAKSLALFFEFIENACVITEKNKCMPAFSIPCPSRNSTIDNRNFAFSNAFA